MAGRTTIFDVARATGTSISTVSRALNGVGRISTARRAEITRAARELGYRRTTEGSAPPSIAVVVQNVANPFFPSLVDGIGRAATAAGALVTVCAIDGWDSLEALRRAEISGVVLVGSDLDAAALDLATGGTTVVAVDRAVPLPGVSTVRSDHAGGAGAVTTHLVELGHRRIGHLAGPAELDVARLRTSGWRHALGEAGIDPDPELVAHGPLDEVSGRALTHRLLAGPRVPTAIVAANDLMALGAIAAVHEHGLTVPGDISVTGFDDIAAASFGPTALTTVRQPVTHLGARAAQLLFDHLRPGALMLPVHEILPVELVVRSSTAPPREDR